MTTYVHGYSDIEARRLRDQADTLADLLHDGTSYPDGAKVLEVGCGTGAQTVSLLARSPTAQLISVDVSAASLHHARARVAAEAPDADVRLLQADLFHLPFADETFDHLFVCFVIEHLADPGQALSSVGRLLRPGGSITVIEGDHGSAFFHPDSAAAQATINCLIDLQAGAGGNSLIGRQLQPLLSSAGYQDVRVRPLTVYADETKPDLVDGFTRNTFTAMVAGVREEALTAGLITETAWEHGIADLRRSADAGGTFHYTFFKGTASKPPTGSNQTGGGAPSAISSAPRS